MTKFIVTVTVQFETYNIIGINELALYHVIRAYLNRESELRLGGKSFVLKGVEEFTIHLFENDEVLDKFLGYIKENNLRKKSMTGRDYFETKYIEEYGTDVTDKYLSPEAENNNEQNDTSSLSMKIFISHSSKNADYGNALVELLTGVGVHGDNIIFTSNDAYGIPIGQNIFNWLKSRISEKPHVIYLLSPEYYSSVACLNEMGAAWIVENEHTMIFTPNFNLSSYEFQSGALDPREIGFYINNQDRLTSFVVSLKSHFTISSNPVIVNQRVREFISRIEKIKTTEPVKKDASLVSEDDVWSTPNVESVRVKEIKEKKPEPSMKIKRKVTGSSKFLSDLLGGKLKDEEVILIHYILDTARFKLGTGWQESHEIENIKAWEDVNSLNNQLSSNYASSLRRFEMRKLTEVSDTTSHGNPKEVRIVDDFQEQILNLPADVESKIDEVVSQNENANPF